MPDLPQPNPSPLSEIAALRLVVEGSISETGTAFFRALVRNLAQALGTLGAWVTEYHPRERKLRALAMWMQGAYVDHYEYAIDGTACQTVVENRTLVHIPERVLELFPRDDDLVPLRAVSYLGTPLLDTDGTVLGHLSVLDDKPMPRNPRAISLFEIFAARAVAEHRRLLIEQELRDREETLSLLLHNALDAILVTDHQGTITRVNPAAERIFGCTAEDLLGEPLREFLTPASATQIGTLLQSLSHRPPGQRHAWIPRDLVARRWDHTVFPAEATLSQFVSRRGTFQAFILRNTNERSEAQRQIQWLTQETEFLRDALRESSAPGELIGRSHSLQTVVDAIAQVAPTNATVLITGETGTGKELVARSIHRASQRADQPLVVVNCAAIPAALIESEFFGHERGAFTGAVSRREGQFAHAHRGTIFLDEVGELPLELQAKLLRVLQEGEFQPLGSTRTIKVDVRVVAATHRNLRLLAQSGKFREDLFFRLHVFPIEVPPLRERGRDLEHLASVFAQRLARRLGRRPPTLTDQHRHLLRQHHWPGNVRELQNVIERALILSTGETLELERAMTGCCTSVPPVTPATSPNQPAADRILTAHDLEAIERANLLRALHSCHGRISGPQGAARLLGLPPSTLSSRLKALGIQRPLSP